MAIKVGSNTYSTDRVDEFFEELPLRHNDVFKYRKYWDKLRAKNHEDYYRFFLFSFMSVHTTWQANVRGYLGLHKMLSKHGGFMPCSGNVFSGKSDRESQKDPLMKELIKSKAGLHTRRYKGIAQFSKDFRVNPDWFYPAKNESVIECRDRIQSKLYGLGLAKTAFALEMAFPDNQEVVCLDTHMIQLFKVKDSNNKQVSGSINKSCYMELEKYWCNKCKKAGVPSAIARHMWWDEKQNQTNTHYWSYVFKKKRYDQCRSN